jgi:hypothetical protein
MSEARKGVNFVAGSQQPLRLIAVIPGTCADMGGKTNRMDGAMFAFGATRSRECHVNSVTANGTV